VFTKLGRVRNIHRIKRTCRAFRDAAERAVQAHRRVCFEEHTKSVESVALAADGRVLTASGKAVKVWRADDGACERTIEVTGHRWIRWIIAVAAQPGGAYFVSSSWDHTVKLWTLDGALERTFDVRGAECVAALPDGVHFVVGCRNEVRLYHANGTLVHAFEGHTLPVLAVAVTPDGQHIISGVSENLVEVWSVATKSLVSTCTGHDSKVLAVAAMPDRQRFLSGSNDDTVRVWLLDGTHQNTFELHTHDVTALAALPDNQHALSGSNDKTVKLFNVNDGTVLRTFTHHTKGVNCLALMPDGLRFISGSEDKTARITEHGLALALTPAYLAGKRRKLTARLEEESRRHQEAREEEVRRHAKAREEEDLRHAEVHAEEDHRHAEEVRRLRAAIERHDQNA